MTDTTGLAVVFELLIDINMAGRQVVSELLLISLLLLWHKHDFFGKSLTYTTGPPVVFELFNDITVNVMAQAQLLW